MILRLLDLPVDENFFLLGPRGSGKTTFIKQLSCFENSLYINLLKASEERRFARNPDQLLSIVAGLPDNITHVIIDEVQKLPKLLDIVHELIETTEKKFILTGSSARKLKHGGANLLAGRAFVYHLYPFCYKEIENLFELQAQLCWGMLPKMFEYHTDEKKRYYLEAYVNTYLKEEIWVEQFVRVLDPFRHFLEVAAQCNGKIINYSNIATDVGVDIKTVQKYYSILEDTLLGFFLEAFQHSFRKRLSKSPKFYFFDTGIVRALSMQLTLPLQEQTSAYGEAFEHFIILQCKILAEYYHHPFRFSYLQTKEGAEIDLVVERPGQKLLLIEIKSTDDIQERHVASLQKLATDLGECEAVCFCRDTYLKRLQDVMVFPWQQGVLNYFGVVTRNNGVSTAFP